MAIGLEFFPQREGLATRSNMSADRYEISYWSLLSNLMPKSNPAIYQVAVIILGYREEVVACCIRNCSFAASVQEASCRSLSLGFFPAKQKEMAELMQEGFKQMLFGSQGFLPL